MSIQAGRLVLTEVKICKGHEADANWRIWPNNKNRDTKSSTPPSWLK